MASYFKMLDECSKQEILEKIRVEVADKRRLVSNTAMEVFKTFGKLHGNSDTRSLYEMTKENIKEFDFGDDIEQLKNRVTQLKTVINAMEINIGSKHKAYVNYNSLFKQYWIDKDCGETDWIGKHVTEIRNILKLSDEEAKENKDYLTQRLLLKSKDIIKVDFNEILFNIRTIYNYIIVAFSINVLPSARDMIKFLLCIEGSNGPRKGEIMDPYIRFEKLDDYIKSNPVWTIGIQKDNTTTFNMDKMPSKYIVVQHGISKDKTKSFNSYLNENDKRYQLENILIKPSICLTSEEIIVGIGLIRRFFNCNKETYVSRTQNSNLIPSDQVRPALKEAFPTVYDQLESKNITIGTHCLRQIYGLMSHILYAPIVEKITNGLYSQSIWITTCLGHNEIHSSLHYQNTLIINVPENIDVSDPAYFENLLLAHMTRYSNECNQQMNKKRQRQEEHDKQILSGKVELISRSGSKVYLDKLKKKLHRPTEEYDKIIKSYIRQLKTENIQITNKAITSLGVGCNTLNDFKKRHAIKSWAIENSIYFN